MGHEIEYRSYPESVDKSKVSAELNNYVSQATSWQEGGGGLPGRICWMDACLNSAEEAKEYIRRKERNLSYFQGAVKYVDYSGSAPSAKEKALAGKVKKCREKWENTRKFAFSGTKSAFRGCPNCNSKLAVKFLTGNNCPVCRADLRSQTAIELERTAFAQWQKVLQQLECERNRPRPGGKVKWLVKIEYHM